MSRSNRTRGGVLRLSAWLALVSAPPLAAQQPLTLEQAVQLALEQSHGANAARATLEAGRYRHRAFNSTLLPQLALSGTLPFYNRSIIQVVQPDGSTLFRAQQLTSTGLTARLSQKLPFTGGELFVSSGLSRLAVSGQQSIETWSSTPVRVGLTQSILKPNTAEWDRRQQSVQIDVDQRRYREAREAIALETTNLYFDVVAAHTALNNAVQNAARNDTLYTLNKGRFEVGKIGENDLLQSELALLRARTVLDGARLTYDRAVEALRLGLQLPAEVPIEVVLRADVPAVEADTGRAVAEALRNRADVSDVELQAVLARRRVAEARLGGALGATVQASVGLNASAAEASLVYQDLLETRQVQVSVDVPLWQWGGRGESVRAARAEEERTASLGQQTMQQLAHETRFAALELAQARRGLGLSATADTVAGKRFEVAYNRYVIGRITLDNLFIAQNEKDQALTQFVQALRGYWLAYYRLRRATLFDFATGQAIR